LGNIRLGGYGIGGSKQVSTSRFDNQNKPVNSITTLDYGYGLGYIGYNILSFDDFHLSIDLGLGGGSVELQIIDKTVSDVDFNQTLKPFGTPSSRANTLEMSFFTYQPSIVAEYILSGFVKIFVAGDYIGTIAGDWKMDDEFNVINVPKLKFDGFTIRAGIYLGIFL
ncbi:MAG: hypothetical protein N3A61_03825, partial [Ignavibacteria bacterium]|nr:hypothetical protein [Ignavibacteria bacterium]